MGSIKTLNNAVPAVKRPLRVSDLQDIWDGLNAALATGTAGAPRILSGFALTTGSSAVSGGVIAFNGQLYVMPDGLATVGDTIYADVAATDNRTFADAAVYPMAVLNLVTKTPTSSSIPIGVLTVDNINAWSVAFIPKNSITGAMLAPGSVGSAQLAANAVQKGNINIDWLSRFGEMAVVDLVIPMSSGTVQSDQVVAERIVGNPTYYYTPVAYGDPTGSTGRLLFGLQLNNQGRNLPASAFVSYAVIAYGDSAPDVGATPPGIWISANQYSNIVLTNLPATGVGFRVRFLLQL